MLNRLKAELAFLASKGRIQEFSLAFPQADGTLQYKGKTLIDLTTWDYLGLATDPQIKLAAQRAIETHGIGTASPRLRTRTRDSHLACEKNLARFFGTESALLFSSKNQLVLSLVTSLVNETHVVFVDELMQSPVADAAVLVGATVATFRIGDGSLAAELERHSRNPEKLVFAETLSPITGEALNFPDFAGVLKKFGASLVADETFACGALGLRGSGLLENERAARVPGVLGYYADLSVGLGGFGAAMLGPAVLTNYLVQRSRTFSGETSPAPGFVVAGSKGIDIAELKAMERQKIANNMGKLRIGLSALGFSFTSQMGPVISVPFANSKLAQEFSDALLTRGFLTEVIHGVKLRSESSFVRMVFGIRHSEKQIDDLLNAIADIFPRVAKGA